METIGIRELKNRLSKYVRKVEAGEVVIVTDRGTVVAELVPPGYAARREVASIPACSNSSGVASSGSPPVPTIRRCTRSRVSAARAARPCRR